MIVYFLTYAVNPSGKVTERPRCHRYEGKVTFSGNEVWLYDSHDRPIRKRRATLFDDSVTPPKLIREDYDLRKLRKFKYVKLPDAFVDSSGDIVNAKGDVIFSGPKKPEVSETIIAP
jgi:hypothetical protein